MSPPAGWLVLDREAARQYLNYLYEPDDWVQFDCFCKPPRPSGGGFRETRRRREIDDRLLDQLEVHNNSPYDLNIYLRTNVLRGYQKNSAFDKDFGLIRHLWLDLDEYAADGILGVLEAGNWPLPQLVVESGGVGRERNTGCQLFFKLKDAIALPADAGGEASGAWIKAIVRAFLVVLRDDPCTATLHRLLRLPGSWNVKRRGELEPRPCRITYFQPENGCWSLEQWAKQLQVPWDPQRRLADTAPHEKAELPRSPEKDSGPKPRWDLIESRCPWAGLCRGQATRAGASATTGSELREPDYYALLSVVGRCENGRKTVHELLRAMPLYNEATTEAKLDQALTRASGPTTCRHVAERLGHAEICGRCPHWEKISSPIELGYQGRRKPDAAAVQRVRDALLAAAKENAAAAVAATLEDSWAMQCLGWLYQREPAAVEGLAHRLVSECGAKSKDAQALVRGATATARRRVERRRRHGGEGGDLEEHEKVCDAAPRAPVPPQLLVPRDYQLSQEGVQGRYYSKASDEKRWELVTSTPLLISGLLHDIDNDCYHARMAYFAHRKWQQLTVPRSALGNSSTIVEHFLPHDIDVTSHNKARVIEWLATFRAVNRDRLPLCEAATALGWHPGPRFLLGQQLYSTAGVSREAGQDARTWAQDALALLPGSAGDEAKMRAFHAAGTLAGWLAAIRPLREHPVAQVGIYVALASVLLWPLGQPTLIFEYAGRSSVGKSACQRIAASACGQPVDQPSIGLVQRWSGTTAGLIGTAAFLRSLPLFLDDTKEINAQDLPAVQSIIYQLANGRERARGDVDRSTQLERSWQLSLLSTGEDPLAMLIDAPEGFCARVMSLWGLPFTRHDAATGRLVERIDAEIAQHYGHALPLFLQYLLTHWAQREQWKTAHEELRAEYGQECMAAGVAPNSPAYRLTGPVATLQVTANLVHEAMPDLPWEVPDMWDVIGKALMESVEGADQAKRAIELAIEFLAAHGRDFFVLGLPDPAPQTGWAGRYDGPGHELCLLSDTLQRILKPHNLAWRRVTRVWYDLGWLARGPDGKQPNRYLAGKSPHMYVIPADVVQKFMPDTKPALGPARPPQQQHFSQETPDWTR